MNAVLDKKDVLALLPTGGGKSICFQVPALAMEGLCVVVSPLIALMKDQVEGLKKREVKAEMVFSGMNARDIDITLDNCIYGKIKFLYISPERIKTELFLERVKKMPVCLIAVDEAHCISQWGYDFRPAYLEIAALREIFPEVPVIALTATATPEVKKDIIEKLLLRKAAVFQKSFVRYNLSYSVFEEEDKYLKLLEILKNVPGAAIVYVRSRKGTQKVAKFLRQHGLRAIWYHAGLTNKQRDEAQEVWIENKVKIMVATNAFGMGIDKPDVRVVVHLDLPENLEAYYQEAGRAGRDELKAYAVIIHQRKDAEELLLKFEQSHPAIDFMKRVYQSMANYYKIAVGSGHLVSFDFSIEDFTKTYNLPALEAFYAIKKLEQAGFIQLNESFYNPSRLHIKLSNKQLYEFQIANEPYDALIKAVLRIYGGELFTDFINIRENQIASLLQLPPNEVEKKLLALNKMDVVIYNPQKDRPQLIFTQPRFDANALPFDKAKIESRKKVELEKLNKIIAYVSNNFLCRTRFLTEYFGEINYQDCGVCDLCLRKKRKENSATFNASIQEHIENNLKLKSLDLKALTSSLPALKEEEVLAMVRNMLENSIIAYDKEGRLYYKS